MSTLLIPSPHQLKKAEPSKHNPSAARPSYAKTRRFPSPFLKGFGSVEIISKIIFYHKKHCLSNCVASDRKLWSSLSKKTCPHDFHVKTSVI
jgi:hypothetical protein